MSINLNMNLVQMISFLPFVSIYAVGGVDRVNVFVSRKGAKAQRIREGRE
jgi:hypothetical protein